MMRVSFSARALEFLRRLGAACLTPNRADRLGESTLARRVPDIAAAGLVLGALFLPWRSLQ